MTLLLNRARMTTSTTGTGTVTLGAAVTRFATFGEAGAVNATAYIYLIEDGNDFETGVGTYTSAGTTLSRDTVVLSKIAGVAGTSKIDLSGSATVSSTLLAGGATQAVQETGTATTTFVTPGVQHFHPSAAKAWGKCAGNASTVDASYGVTSVTNGAAGINTWNWSVTFSSAEYGAIPGVLFGGSGVSNLAHYITSLTTTTAVVLAETAAGTDFDPTSHFISAFGDL